MFEPSTLYHGGSSSDNSMVVGVGPWTPGSHETWVTVEHVSQGLCAKTRPTFFRGVSTVVTKLFHIVEPDVALFGRKDYQQWKVISRMVRWCQREVDLARACTIQAPPRRFAGPRSRLWDRDRGHAHRS